MQSQYEIGKVFLVGCPRSGTTLLQCLLSAHSQIASLPETYFFDSIRSSQRRRRILGLPSPGMRNWYRKLLARVELRPHVHVPRAPLLAGQYARAFTTILNELAQQQGKSVWLEKTPKHIEHIDRIERLVPGAKFIHILRRGPDNIASLYDVALKHSDHWNPKVFDLDHCIAVWKRNALQTLRHASRPNHCVVGYRHVVEETSATLTHLCSFLGLEYEPGMLTGYARQFDKVTNKFEVWKSGTKEAIHNQDDTKFQALFSEEQRTYILQCIAEVDLSPLGATIL